MADWAAKRFWKETRVEAEGDGFSVLLDGRPVRTPAKAALTLPTRALAEMVAKEWDAQTEKVDPTTMPTTRGVNAAIDRVGANKSAVVEMLADYGDSDLLCYRAAYPDPLVARQKEAWDPILDWLDATFGARLDARAGVMHVAQAADSLSALKAEVEKLDPFELSAFHDLVTLSGSLGIALAATHDFLPIDTLWACSRVDEHFQAEQWGEDEEAVQEEQVKRDAFLHAHTFFSAVQK